MKFLIDGTVFVVGALAALSLFTAGLFFNQYEIFKPAYDFLHSAVRASVVEEIIKYSAVLVLIPLIRIKPVNIPFIGIGFGFTEAIVRLIEEGNARIKPFWAHIVFGLTMALFFYLASKATRPILKYLYYSFALIFPVALHLLYNLVIIK